MNSAKYWFSIGIAEWRGYLKQFAGRKHTMPEIEVHGHRGCRGLRPENTLPAFLHATRLGVDVLEMDVVLSADGEVVVSHEPWFAAAICRDPAGRTIDSTHEQQHKIYRLPYAAIRAYDCGSTRHPDFPQQQLEAAPKPLLREVFVAVEQLAARLGRPAVQYSIEIKCSPTGDGIDHPLPGPMVAAVGAVVRAANVAGRVRLLSFDKRVLQAARQQLPALPLCLLVEDLRPLPVHLIELGFVPAIYGPMQELVTPILAAEAGALAMQLVPWTVNTEVDMRRLLQLPVSGITTDYPDCLLRLLGRL